jgi:hypothetical protein
MVAHLCRLLVWNFVKILGKGEWPKHPDVAMIPAATGTELLYASLRCGFPETCMISLKPQIRNVGMLVHLIVIIHQ